MQSIAMHDSVLIVITVTTSMYLLLIRYVYGCSFTSTRAKAN